MLILATLLYASIAFAFQTSISTSFFDDVTTVKRPLRSATPFEHPIVHTADGDVRGVGFDDFQVWRGIPYAQPPVGALRWQPPKPANRWSGVRNATTYQPGCMQACKLPPMECPPQMSEDCLYVDVYTPSASAMADDVRRPVLVFFAGGGFFQGLLLRDSFVSTAYVWRHRRW